MDIPTQYTTSYRDATSQLKIREEGWGVRGKVGAETEEGNTEKFKVQYVGIKIWGGRMGEKESLWGRGKEGNYIRNRT